MSPDEDASDQVPHAFEDPGPKHEVHSMLVSRHPISVVMTIRRPFRVLGDAAALAAVAGAVAVAWTIQPDAMQADTPRLREVRIDPSTESTLGTLIGPDGRTIVLLPGDPEPRFRLFADTGREITTVEDSSILKTDHHSPDPGRLLADVPTWTAQD